MRHRNGYKKVGKPTAHRKAMFRNMATSLLEEERIHTTVAKAKAIRPIVERLVTVAVRGNKETVAENLVFARRKVDSFIMDKKTTQKLFKDIAPRFADRPGGYLRIIRTGFRSGDKAEMAAIEFVDYNFDNSAKDASPENVKKSNSKKSEDASKESK